MADVLPYASRLCIVCGAMQEPFVFRGQAIPMTAHEFACFKKAPHLVPSTLAYEFEKQLAGERHRAAAERGVETRRRKTK